MSGIAVRHGVSTSALARANGISNPDLIYAGQVLDLPGAAAAAQPTRRNYVVRAGETLSHIAVRNGISAKIIAALNNIADVNRIFAGQQIVLPGPAGRAAPAPTVRSTAARYTVKAGETLSQIALRHGVPQARLARANRLADTDYIFAGQRLRIPRVGAAPKVAAPARSIPRAEIGKLIEQTAYRYGWNPAFVKAVAWMESGWQSDVVSSQGAVGVMQVLPSTGAFVSRQLVGRDLDLRKPKDNIEAGVAFLDYLYPLAGGDPKRILGGYYQGLTSMRRNGVYDSTRNYIATVLELKKRFE